jgi:hypothetical protein
MIGNLFTLTAKEEKLLTTEEKNYYCRRRELRKTAVAAKWARVANPRRALPDVCGVVKYLRGLTCSLTAIRA